MANHLFGSIRQAMPEPEKIFIDPVGRRRLTYGDLLGWSGRMANAIVARGVKPGDRVAVQVEKSVEAIVLYIACVRAGAVFVPLNPAYTLVELDYFIADSEPALIVVSPDNATGIEAIALAHSVRAVDTLGVDGTGTLMERLDHHKAVFADVARGPDDLAAILYTSGTTGRSKGAMITHENLASNARALVEAWRFTRDDVLIHALPIFHTHGLFVAINTVLFSGAAIIFLPRFDAGEVIHLMPRATVLMGVPTFYVRLLAHAGLNRDVVRHIRLFVSGSAPLLPETFRAFAERTGQIILERYGMTETNMITSNPYDRPRVAGTVGPALPGISVRVVDRDTAMPVEPGTIGMIEVKGPNVFKGYWRMPEKTEAEFRPDGYFVTGDLGLIDRAGYVQIVGRDKDLVISGGLNVYPKEVETEIDQIPGVVESAVIGVPHPDFGEGVTAVVVRAPAVLLDEAAVLDALEGRLARFKQPKRVFFVEDLPRNAMGKVQKAVLRDTYKAIYEV
ncbi:malonate--CoA ligase [Segnochrobactrum spirostomi]|uniref:Malonyl-CoA synthase n=1 Tax=Segnochrobactrum spirostomi TaxID=2608987 RepID=A0A6A7Y1C0_9HYPH|nr:malonyl-CoA synthase [Segnochrobactrum spirostomi]MQT11911.1 malonyl-CoA synthase [Segnochrobactrum spirostomi]